MPGSGVPAADLRAYLLEFNRDRRPTSRARGEANNGGGQAGRGVGQALGHGIDRSLGTDLADDSGDSGHGTRTYSTRRTW